MFKLKQLEKHKYWILFSILILKMNYARYFLCLLSLTCLYINESKYVFSLTLFIAIIVLIKLLFLFFIIVQKLLYICSFLKHNYYHFSFCFFKSLRLSTVLHEKNLYKTEEFILFFKCVLFLIPIKKESDVKVFKSSVIFFC